MDRSHYDDAASKAIFGVRVVAHGRGQISEALNQPQGWHEVNFGAEPANRSV
jgi:hypothetical protein